MGRNELTKHILETSDGARDIFLELATGLGKTKLACEITHRNEAESILVIVPELALIENFKDDMIKHGFGNYLEKTTFNAYNSLKKHEGKEYDVIILDECHHLSPKRRESLTKVRATKKRIFLSATVEDEDLVEFIYSSFSVFHKKITLKQAQEMGILPPLKVRYVDVKLGDTVRNWKAVYGKRIVYLTEKDYYKYLCDKIDWYKSNYEETKSIQDMRMMKRMGLERQSFLAEVKEAKSKEIIQWFKDNNHRFVVFAGSIEQAERLGGMNAIHSKSNQKPELVSRAGAKSKVSRYLVDSYNRGEINYLVAVGMLQEGHNLKDTKYGLAIQLGNKERKGVQISGRLIRAEDGVLVVPRVVGTVDERFVENSLQSVI